MSDGPSGSAASWQEAHGWLKQVNEFIYGAAQAAQEAKLRLEDAGARLHLLNRIAPLWIMYRPGDLWESRVLQTCAEIRKRRSRRGERAITIAPEISGTSYAEALCKLGRFLTRGTMDDRLCGCERLARIVQTCFPMEPGTDPLSIGLVLSAFAGGGESHWDQVRRMFQEVGSEPSSGSALIFRFFGQELGSSLEEAYRGEMPTWVANLLQNYPYRQVVAELELEFEEEPEAWVVPPTPKATPSSHEQQDTPPDEMLEKDTRRTTSDQAEPPKGRDRPRKKPGRPKKNATEIGKNEIQREKKLYTDYQAAKRTTGVTKPEFLRARRLPPGDLAALERGRKHIEAERKTTGKN